MILPERRLVWHTLKLTRTLKGSDLLKTLKCREVEEFRAEFLSVHQYFWSMTRRNRYFYFLVDVCLVAMGLASRRYAAALPDFLALYAGDTLWALMVFVSIGFLAPRLSSFRVAAIALSVSYAVETSQLYHTQWIDSFRHTRLGGLVLGYGFLWSDIACYTVGIALGVMIEVGVRKARES
jgi:hypothetical protein